MNRRLLATPGESNPSLAPHMTAWEVAVGCVFDRTPPSSPLGSPALGALPLAALRVAVRRALLGGPCAVSFSGGRDSSAVLAVALDEARLHGLPRPVAFTLRYPGAEGADEDAWQEFVVRELGVVDWEKVDIEPAESELLGPTARRSLVEHGLLWSPATHLAAAWLPRLAGMTVLTGEGGDEVLGAQRITPLRSAMSTVMDHPRRSADVALLRRAVRPLQPAAWRRRRWISEQGDLLSWLRPDARDVALGHLAVGSAGQPLSWRAAVRAEPYRSAVRRGEVARRLVAARWKVTVVDPLHDPGFVEAFARDGGLLGWSGRDAAMHRLFHSLLPDAILYRRSKAYFNRAFFGPETREVVGNITVDVHPEWVDQDRLRAMWREDLVHAGVTALAQAAFLDAAGLSRTGSSGFTCSVPPG